MHLELLQNKDWTSTVRTVKYHELKTWSVYWSAINCGAKTAEVRFNDRDYEVGDKLILREWSPSRQEYTGRTCRRYITHIMYGRIFGLEDGYVLLSLRLPVLSGTAEV